MLLLKRLLIGVVLYLLMPYLFASAYGFIKAIVDAGKPRRRIYYMRPPSPDPGLKNRLYNRLYMAFRQEFLGGTRGARVL